ncbi:hypothetical protein K456DRAFT_1933795 [Colletotrichum gloeosporioides 23]|nr:hypothetical protein K456DRAFT_1933795 [Colletotrichum gloeosporioides 23]
MQHRRDPVYEPPFSDSNSLSAAVIYDQWQRRKEKECRCKDGLTQRLFQRDIYEENASISCGNAFHFSVIVAAIAVVAAATVVVVVIVNILIVVVIVVVVVWGRRLGPSSWVVVLSRRLEPPPERAEEFVVLLIEDGGMTSQNDQRFGPVSRTLAPGLPRVDPEGLFHFVDHGKGNQQQRPDMRIPIDLVDVFLLGYGDGGHQEGEEVVEETGNELFLGRWAIETGKADVSRDFWVKCIRLPDWFSKLLLQDFVVRRLRIDIFETVEFLIPFYRRERHLALERGGRHCNVCRMEVVDLDNAKLSILGDADVFDDVQLKREGEGEVGLWERLRMERSHSGGKPSVARVHQLVVPAFLAMLKVLPAVTWRGPFFLRPQRTLTAGIAPSEGSWLPYHALGGKEASSKLGKQFRPRLAIRAVNPMAIRGDDEGDDNEGDDNEGGGNEEANNEEEDNEGEISPLKA